MKTFTDYYQLCQHYAAMSDNERIADWIERHRAEKIGNKIVLYHGTRKAKAIRTSGIFNAGTYFTTDPEYAAHAPNGSPGNLNSGKGKIQIMKVAVDPKLLYLGIFCKANVAIPVEEVK
jgi:hypothetical protein